MKTVIKYLSAFSFPLICMLFVFPTHSSANVSIYMDETESDDTEAEETIDISPKIGNGLNSIDYDATQRNAVIDVISYENLNVGETYTVTGLLYEVCSNESGEVTTLNTGITGSCTFSVDQTDSAIEISRREYVNSGYASVIYHMDSYGDIAVKTFVARETITLDKDTKLRIVDLSEDRYIHIPDFSFDFTDTSTGLHQTSPSSYTSLTVTIEYSNLVAGEEYSITGDILKSTSSRKPVWSSVTDGNNLPIRLSQFYGMQLYPRFTLLRNGHKVATYDFPCLSVPSPTPTPGPTSTPTPSPEPAYEPAYSDYSVYVTRTGQCYHQSGCSYLRRGASEISRSEAVNRGLRPCSRCHPG